MRTSSTGSGTIRLGRLRGGGLAVAAGATIALLAAAPALTGCPEPGGVVGVDFEPQVVIVTPIDGQELNEGVLVELQGQVSDRGQLATSLAVTWASSEEGVLFSGSSADDGSVTLQTELSVGAHTLTLRAIDLDANEASASVDVTVLADQPPTVTILYPLDGSVLPIDDPIDLSAQVADAESPPEALLLDWISSEQGTLHEGLVPGADGLSDTTAPFAEGEHVLTARVTDPLGNVGTAEITVLMLPANGFPTCSILAPADDAILAFGADTELLGRIDDTEPAALLTAEWSSSVDGALGSVSANAAGEVSLTVSTLTAGPHTLTLDGADDRGATCSASVEVDVSIAPEVTITAPATASFFNEGTEIDFAGVVADDVEPPEALTVTWASDSSGPLGASPADPTTGIVTLQATLPRGAHTVTLQAEDSSGLIGSDTVDVVVNGVPSAPVVSLTPSTPVTGDDLEVVIIVAPVDPDADPLTLQYEWLLFSVPQAAHTGDTLPASATSAGDVWEVQVRAWDGNALSEPGAAVLAIGNTPPQAPGVGITPDPAFEDDDLVCSVVVPAPDVDGDVSSYTWAWLVDGAPTSHTAFSLLATETVGCEVWTCEVTPDDGVDVGEPGVADMLIELADPDCTCPDPAAPGPAWSLDFDGVDDLVVVGNDAALSNTGSWTAEAWVFATDTSGERPVFARESAGGAGNEFWFGISDGTFGLRFDDGVGAGWDLDVTTSAPVSAGAWHHLAAVWDASAQQWSLYRDGAWQGTGSWFGSRGQTNTTFTLGRNSDTNTDSFAGLLSDVRLWHVARSEAEIQADMAEPTCITGLVGRWLLDDGSGQVLLDSSPSGLDGQLGATTVADAQDPLWSASVPP